MNDPLGQESRQPVEFAPSPEMVLAEERARFGVQRVPYRRLRVAKRVVIEQQTVTVDVRREELVVEEMELEETLPASSSVAAEPLVLVLSREVVDDVRLRAEPVELVRVSVDRRTEREPVDVDLRREQADVQVQR
jgi:stress response protein YsnF